MAVRPEGAPLISFRYHVVTLAAVFLALAIGLLGGGAFVQPALQQQLQDRTDAAEAAADQLRADIDDLRAEVAGLSAFSDAALPYLTAGRLPAVPVVLVTQTGVEDEVVAQATGALGAAGAEILTTVSATALLASQDPAVQQQLAEIIGQPAAPGEELPALAAAALAQRLSTPAPPTPEDDVLTELMTAGFLAPVGEAPDREQIGGTGQVVLVLSSGTGEEAALPPEAFAVPLVRTLSGLGRPVSAGESIGSDFAFVSAVRDEGLDGVVTVDDLDQAMGGAALVLGIDRLLATGLGGAFGVKDGAEPLPPP